jgi:hypothetical protein
VGAILSATLLGAVFKQRATSDGLHSIAIVLAVVAAGVVVASIALQRARRTSPAPDPMG